MSDLPLIVTAHGWSPVDGRAVFRSGLLSTPPAIAMYYFSKKLINEVNADVLQLIYQGSKDRSLLEMSSSTREVLSTYADRQIIFVGHSMGGLLGFDSDFVDAYVCIGTPFGGSRFSPPDGFSVSALEMQKDSRFLSKVPGSLSVPSLAVLPYIDAIVGKKSAVGPCGDSQVIPWSTHLSILLSGRVVLEISSWIKYNVLDVDPTKEEVSTGFYSSVSV